MRGLTKRALSFASGTCCTCGSATTFVSWSEVMSRLLQGSSGRRGCVAADLGGQGGGQGRERERARLAHNRVTAAARAR